MNNKVRQIGEVNTNNTIWLSSCHSTNSFAKEYMLNNSVENGWTVSTYNQTNGRGQADSTWESEPFKNLTFSCVFNFSEFEIKDLFFLNKAVSIGVKTFLENFQIVSSIKWPNDIYIKNKKVAGILIEPHLSGNFIKNAVMGIGLNVNQLKFKSSRATSLQLTRPSDYSIEKLLPEIVGCIKEKIDQYKSQTVIDSEYLDNLYLINKVAAFRSKEGIFMGIIRGINDTGNLIIETEGGQSVFGLKEVEFLS